ADAVRKVRQPGHLYEDCLICHARPMSLLQDQNNPPTISTLEDWHSLLRNGREATRRESRIDSRASTRPVYALLERRPPCPRRPTCCSRCAMCLSWKTPRWTTWWARTAATPANLPASLSA